jgi:hypothetical protein
MSSAATFYAALQVFAALLIYVAVYLALVLCTITCLVGAELISEHASVIRDYGVKPVSLDTHILSETDGETSRSSRRPTVSPLSEGSSDGTRLLGGGTTELRLPVRVLFRTQERLTKRTPYV